MPHSTTAKNIFITGASTGFGHEIAALALKNGYRVTATARNPKTIAALSAPEYADRLLCLPLDVTQPAQIQDAVARSLERFGAIDALINNAGYGVVGALEELSLDEIRQQFDTNVFGAFAMIQAVLPSMRQRRKGHIVNMSSVAGFVCRLPGLGIYAATKHALEGMSQGLAKEVQPLGLHVTMINPGPFRTDFAGRSMRVAERHIADYDATVHASANAYQASSGQQKGDPHRAAAAILRLLELDRPPFTLPLGQIAYDSIRGKLRETLTELEQFETLGLPTDYPTLAGK